MRGFHRRSRASYTNDINVYIIHIYTADLMTPLYMLLDANNVYIAYIHTHTHTLVVYYV